MLGLKFFMHAAQIAPRVCGQISARIHFLFAVAKQSAIKPSNFRCPRQLHKRLRLGNTNQFRSLGAISHIISRAIREQVDGCAINQLKTFFSNGFPMIRGNAFAHNFSGYGDKLKIQIFDAEGIDHLPHFFDFLIAPRRFHKTFKVHFGHFNSPLFYLYFLPFLYFCFHQPSAPRIWAV